MAETPERLVPDDVIPHKHLPPLRYRDLPEPIPLRKMIGPSIMLTGLALGSGEFVFWPYITYRVGFIFFWACLLGVGTQYFLNMEIERWTMATGESAVTGFCRLSWHWSWVFLLLNIIPWAWPGWATGAATMLSWLVWEPAHDPINGTLESQHVAVLAVAGLLLVGVVLTLGPVVYNTVEKLQLVLVSLVFVLMIVLAIAVVRPPHVAALVRGSLSVGTMPPLSGNLDMMFLLGALAFAGAGGTTNLCQANYIKDKGYAMGRYIGRITSPVTGNEEAVSDIGYHFEHTPENMRRWHGWWRAASWEHLLTFVLPCAVSLALLSLISYALIYGSEANYSRNFSFILGQADEIGARLGSAMRLAFLVIGIAVLLTTELGVLDACARISTDIVKVNYCRNVDWITDSRLYFAFLWGEIALGCVILLGFGVAEPQKLLKISAAMNGGVMFLYSLVLLYLNNKVLSRRLSMHPVRFVAVVWSCAFFGYFTIKALGSVLS